MFAVVGVVDNPLLKLVHEAGGDVYLPGSDGAQVINAGFEVLSELG